MGERLDVGTVGVPILVSEILNFSSTKQMEGAGKVGKKGPKAEVCLSDNQAGY